MASPPPTSFGKNHAINPAAAPTSAPLAPRGQLAARSNRRSVAMSEMLNAAPSSPARIGARATDSESKNLYREASAAREEQIRAVTDLRQARERLLANLARIVSNLEGVPTRVVRMRVLDDRAERGSSDEIGWEIGRINGELAALEQTLEVLVGEKSL